MEKNSKIYAAGYRRIVDSAIVSNLKSNGYINLIFRTHSELHLINQFAFGNFFSDEKHEYVILEAAKGGGFIANNTYRGNFIYDNLSYISTQAQKSADFCACAFIYNNLLYISTQAQNQ